MQETWCTVPYFATGYFLTALCILLNQLIQIQLLNPINNQINHRSKYTFPPAADNFRLIANTLHCIMLSYIVLGFSRGPLLTLYIKYSSDYLRQTLPHLVFSFHSICNICREGSLCHNNVSHSLVTVWSSVGSWELMPSFVKSAWDDSSMEKVLEFNFCTI